MIPRQGNTTLLASVLDPKEVTLLICEAVYVFEPWGTEVGGRAGNGFVFCRAVLWEIRRNVPRPVLPAIK